MQSNASMSVNFKKIKQRQIVNLISENKLGSNHDFFKLNSLGYDASVHASYNRHVKKFLVKEDIDRVWDHYKTISPQDAWNGNMLSFGLLYSKKNNSLIYTGDAYPGIEEGQIIFINIRLLGGLLNLAVAHNISEVNEQEKFIRISYLENGTSEGSQWLRFQKTPEGFTEILHETLYKSQSKFRDKNLYPVLHEKAITEFHRNVKSRLSSSTVRV